jgi:hypothetical protein
MVRKDRVLFRSRLRTGRTKRSEEFIGDLGKKPFLRSLRGRSIPLSIERIPAPRR